MDWKQIYNDNMNNHYATFNDYNDISIKFAVVAELAAQEYYIKTGRKIYDPGYMGDSFCITTYEHEASNA